MKYLLAILSIVLIFSCTKEKQVIPTPDGTANGRIFKYLGDYKVYDTNGVFMYDMNISFFQTDIGPNYHPIDSIMITNFADTFDLSFQFISTYTDQTYNTELLDIGFHDSIVDYNNKSWRISGKKDDYNTSYYENVLIDDTIVMYFQKRNNQFYIQEGQPLVDEILKHVAVKQ